MYSTRYMLYARSQCYVPTCSSNFTFTTVKNPFAQRAFIQFIIISFISTFYCFSWNTVCFLTISNRMYVYTYLVTYYLGLQLIFFYTNWQNWFFLKYISANEDEATLKNEKNKMQWNEPVIKVIRSLSNIFNRLKWYLRRD